MFLEAYACLKGAHATVKYSCTKSKLLLRLMGGVKWAFRTVCNVELPDLCPTAAGAKAYCSDPAPVPRGSGSPICLSAVISTIVYISLPAFLSVLLFWVKPFPWAVISIASLSFYLSDSDFFSAPFLDFKSLLKSSHNEGKGLRSAFDNNLISPSLISYQCPLNAAWKSHKTPQTGMFPPST